MVQRVEIGNQRLRNSETFRVVYSFSRQPVARALVLLVLIAGSGSWAIPAWGTTCTTQAEMQPQDRDALIAAATPLAQGIAAQNFDLLHAQLLPAVAGDWESIRSGAQAASSILKGGELHWRNAYLLDATDLKAPTDAQFFCTNAENSLTVTINLRSLPIGRYALMLGDFAGSPLAGQIALILGVDTTSGGAWKLGGLFAREGAFDGHDGVWYWTQAREQATNNQSWSAWFSYDAARLLLLPVDFLSSPNLEKLVREQAHLKASPLDVLPLTVTAPSQTTGPTGAGKSWRITAVRVDATLHTPDLGLTYEGTGLTEPQAARAEAVAVMSALLKLHPELRNSFHGLWAYAEKDGKQSYAIEQAMHDIP